VTNTEAARVAGRWRRDKLEAELVELEGRMDDLKKSDKPVRFELERLAKRKLVIMRELGLV
jgi:hypothetical protein